VVEVGGLPGPSGLGAGQGRGVEGQISSLEVEEAAAAAVAVVAAARVPLRQEEVGLTSVTEAVATVPLMWEAAVVEEEAADAEGPGYL